MTSKKKFKRIILCFFIAALSLKGAAQSPDFLKKDSVLHQMRRVANWQIGEFNAGRVSVPKKDWQNGALYTGLMALLKIDSSNVYSDFLYGIGETNNWDMGSYHLFADDYCVAQLYTEMYMRYHQPKMIAKWRALADTIVAHPFNEPLEVAKDLNHREWAWCDALYMGPPGLALLSVATGNPQYLNKADSLWWKTSDYLYDRTEHLYYRDSRFFDRKEANGQKVFWSRGNGWVMGGLVRMMDNMPENFKNRKKYEQQFKQMAARIASLQQADGSWHASLLDPATFNEKETSGTGFYCYALSWGVNHKLLNKAKYLPVITRAWQALISSIHSDGKLGYVQNVGDKPVMAGYDTSNVYGVGAFLLAGSELYKLKIK